jgi:hypothetical protein
LLGDINASVGREDVFKPTLGNESLHEISNDNVVTRIESATEYKDIALGAFLDIRELSIEPHLIQ